MNENKLLLLFWVYNMAGEKPERTEKLQIINTKIILNNR